MLLFLRTEYRHGSWIRPRESLTERKNRWGTISHSRRKRRRPIEARPRNLNSKARKIEASVSPPARQKQRRSCAIGAIMLGMALTSLLEEVLEAWQYTRAGIIAEIRNLSEADLKFRPRAESRSPAELAVHIAQSGLVAAGELTKPDGDFQRKSYPQFIKEYAGGLPAAKTKTQLVKLLVQTHSVGERKIRAAGELFMLQGISRFDGERGTRLAWMNHAISHEDYHRGQLAVYARLVGRVPALTQLIHGTS